MNTGGYPDGMTQHDHDKAYGRDAEGDEIKTIPAWDKKKQNVFTRESLKNPLLKNVIKGLDEFDTYEAKQEAGKFGIKPKRRDDR